VDSVDALRTVIERLLTDHTVVPYAYGEIEILTVFDRQSDRYLVMLTGWNGVRRVHGCLIHLDIRDGQVWVQRDGTEHGVARELVEAGVSPEQIVLGFRRPADRRPLRTLLGCC